jgi:hypothetical protein
MRKYWGGAGEVWILWKKQWDKQMSFEMPLDSFVRFWSFEVQLSENDKYFNIFARYVNKQTHFLEVDN